jgi:sialate O-acetylesterase
LALLMTGGTVRAEVKVAGVFGQHMVLQRGVKVPVWGTGKAGEKVVVSFGDQRVETAVGERGAWRVELAAMPADKMGKALVVEGENRVRFEDVLVGEVWVVSGQSNMQFSLKASKEGAEELAQADRPLLRLAIVGQRAAKEPVEDREVGWKICTPETARGFSAVGYGLGKELLEKLNVPVGVVQAAVSGTPAQSWTSIEGLKSDATLGRYVEQYEKMKAGEKADGMPSSLYNGMIAPLTNMPIAGVAWYQGESNTGDADVYATLFGAMVKDWRRAWGGDVPFVWVQLPANQERVKVPEESKWSELREAQAEVLALPKTGMAVTLDLSGERTILHPLNKREVGRRLALEARRVAYGEKVERSPLVEKVSMEGDKVRVTFAGTKRLVVGAPVVRDPLMPSGKDLTVKGFAVAGEDRKWVWAQGKVEGTAVVLWSDEVKKPMAVRYGWGNNPEVNLYGEEGLPAGPFRVERWGGP